MSTVAAGLPIERLIARRAVKSVAAAAFVTPVALTNPGPDRPGCEAADETLVVKGHLEGLAQGRGGFGVLRTSKTRLENAAKAARRANAPSVADTMEGIADVLPDVHTPEQAARVLKDLELVERQTWDLAQKCGKSLPPNAMNLANDLAAEVTAGRITKDEAVKALNDSTGG